MHPQEASQEILITSGQDGGLGVSSTFNPSSTSGGSKGIRIPVYGLKGRCPSPLDDGAAGENAIAVPANLTSIAECED